jgi:hypothetical protein
MAQDFERYLQQDISNEQQQIQMMQSLVLDVQTLLVLL